MRSCQRPLFCVATLVGILVSGNFHGASAQGPSLRFNHQGTVDVRGLPTNINGAPVVDERLVPITYTRLELEAQQAGAPLWQWDPGPEACPPQITPQWAYASFGNGIGLSNIVIAVRWRGTLRTDIELENDSPRNGRKVQVGSRVCTAHEDCRARPRDPRRPGLPSGPPGSRRDRALRDVDVNRVGI